MFELKYIPELAKQLEYYGNHPGSFKKDVEEGKLSEDQIRTLYWYSKSVIWTLDKGAP